jgi:hypothetical protein
MPREVIIQNLVSASNRLEANPLSAVDKAEYDMWYQVLEAYDAGAGEVAWPFPTGEKP